MKKFVSTIAALVVLGFCAPVSAQEMKPDNRYKGYPKSLIEWPKAPPDIKACQALEFYEPADLHLRKYAGRVKVADVRIQKFDECRWMLTRNKWRWVLRPKGTKILVDDTGRDLFDGGSPAGKVCNNPSPFGVPIMPEKPEPPTPVKPEPIRVKPTPIPQPTARPVVTLQPTPTPPPPPLRWGLSGSVARDSYTGSLADRDLCAFKDWSLFAGVTYGDPQRLFARATFTAVFIDDGSSSIYTCANCGTISVISRGMKVYGGNIEVVGLLGPRSWKVQPTLYLEGGGGVVTGEGDRYVTHGSITSVERVDAREFFGYHTTAHGGGGAGLTWHASPNVSVEAFGKYRYPYGMSVGISLTKWLGKK
jgi:hypothetical protein